MDRRRNCPGCERETLFRIETRRDEHTIRGEKLLLDLPVLCCSECGIELFDEELTTKALREAYDEVRKRKGMPTPEELKKLRTDMGLSQRDFAKLLGWSHITIHRYENGGLPGEAHATVLDMIRNDRSYVLKLLEKNAESFDANVVPEIKSKLTRFVFVENAFVSDITRGNRPFSFEKLGAMVAFFASNATELFKTKLLKLLWYADFLHFKRHGVSISGLRYVHLPYGPVPDNYTQYLGRLEAGGQIRIEPVPVGESEGELIQALGQDLSVLTDTELQTLHDIQRRFESWSAAELSRYSHEEKAYRVTRHREVISYRFADELSIE
jgi:putative zinc finger/helix-turn-helix YgiT family protein